MELEMMKIGDREFPILGYVKTKQAGTVPLVDIPMMSDYKWHLRSLQSRLENPELYRRELGEDVEVEIEKLRRVLAQYDEQGTRLTLMEVS